MNNVILRRNDTIDISALDRPRSDPPFRLATDSLAKKRASSRAERPTRAPLRVPGDMDMTITSRPTFSIALSSHGPIDPRFNEGVKAEVTVTNPHDGGYTKRAFDNGLTLFDDFFVQVGTPGSAAKRLGSMSHPNWQCLNGVGIQTHFKRILEELKQHHLNTITQYDSRGFASEVAFMNGEYAALLLAEAGTELLMPPSMQIVPCTHNPHLMGGTPCVALYVEHRNVLRVICVVGSNKLLFHPHRAIEDLTARHKTILTNGAELGFVPIREDVAGQLRAALQS